MEDSYWVKYQDRIYPPEVFIERFKGVKIEKEEIIFVDPLKILERLEKLMEASDASDRRDYFKKKIELLKMLL